jgi:hypothetical protein
VPKRQKAKEPLKPDTDNETTVPPSDEPSDGSAEDNEGTEEKPKERPEPLYSPTPSPTETSTKTSPSERDEGLSQDTRALLTNEADTEESEPKRHNTPEPLMPEPDTRTTLPAEPLEGDKADNEGGETYW